jgi:uncharacterized repeat protein (TIGR02543 family)
VGSRCRCRGRLCTLRHEVGPRRRARGHRATAIALLTLVATWVIAPVTQASATPRAQSATTSTLSVNGVFSTVGGNGTIATANLLQVGDLLVIWVKSRFTGNPPIQVLNITTSGTGHIGNLVPAIQYYTVDHPNNDDEIWFAPVTSAGNITLTFSWSGSSSSDYNEYSTQEFQPSTLSTYSLDTTGSDGYGTSTVTMQFPPLTTSGSGELYAGYNSNSSTGGYTTPTTAGYVRKISPDNDAIIFDPDVSGPQLPLTTMTSASPSQSSIGVLIVATPDYYNVTFNSNLSTGGSMSVENDNALSALTANAFTRNGHTFAGWNTAANGSGTSYDDSAVYSFTANMTLYAQWTPDYYNVTFDGNLSTSGSMSVENDNALSALTANTFTRNGHTFAGWNTAANGSGTSYDDGATFPFASAVTLYAQWTADYFKVTFNGNGSTNGSMKDETDNAPAKLSANAFARTGYTFAGWSTVANGSGARYAGGAKYPFGSAFTLYAQWTADYFKVRFVGNGSTRGSMKADTDNAPAKLSANAFARTGYTFAGWSTSSNAKGISYANRARFPFKKSAALYAQWTAIVPHASRIIGSVFVGQSRRVTIVGTGFFKGLYVKSNERGTTVRILAVRATNLSLTVTVGKGSPLGRHTFTIVMASKKTCTINYITSK